MNANVEVGCTLILGFQGPDGKPMVISVIEDFNTVLDKLFKVNQVELADSVKQTQQMWTFNLVDGTRFMCHPDVVAGVKEGVLF